MHRNRTISAYMRAAREDKDGATEPGLRTQFPGA